MIRIRRPDTPPAVLSGRGREHCLALCSEFCQAPQAYREGTARFDFRRAIYAHRTVRQALLEAQHGKCAFCESKIEHVAYGDVEHFRPKGGYRQRPHEPLRRPGYYWLAYEWANLFLACQLCNQRFKANRFPLADARRRATSHHDDLAREDPLLIDPAQQDPEAFISFRDEFAYAIDDNPVGRETIDVLGLDRQPLNERRQDKLTRLKCLRDVAHVAPSPLRDQARALLRQATSATAEYAAMARAALPPHLRSADATRPHCSPGTPHRKETRMKLGFIADNHLEGVEADCRFSVDHDFEGLEFNYWANFAELTAETVGQMKAILDKYDVPCAALGLWGWNHIAPDPAEREAALGQLDRAIEFAATLGASILITGGGDVPDAPQADKAAEFARVFPPYVERVKDAGMQMAMYPVHGNSFFQSIDDYKRVWDLGLDVGIKLDCANLQHHGDDYLPILRDHGDRVAHFHIKEHLYMDGQLVSQPAAGMGDIAWGKIMAFLYEHGYEGYLSIEPHGPIWSRGELRRTMLLLTQRHIAQFLL